MYQQLGVQVRWKDFYGGSGDMAVALEEGSIDLAVILTEGIIRAICEGNPSVIVQEFVRSPLIWGIHVGARSTYTKVDELKGTKAAISRYGSGSHLMAYVNARRLGWEPEQSLSFEVVDNLEGALKALPGGTADYFMWEKFTTKPFVDSGIFRCIGQCPTPWPCFVIAARTEFMRQHELLTGILDIINDITHGFKQLPAIDQIISRRYGQQLEDVQSWLELTEWSQEQLSKDDCLTVQRTLFELGLIEQEWPVEKFLKKS
jgi:ABC-type nitrate/sulfonate/bicarbonate transport system substrate-binding protein